MASIEVVSESLRPKPKWTIVRDGRNWAGVDDGDVENDTLVSL